MDFGAIISFFATNWDNILGGILTIIGGASVLARVTPWEWDNKALDFIQKIIDGLALSKKPTP